MTTATTTTEPGPAGGSAGAGAATTTGGEEPERELAPEPEPEPEPDSPPLPTRHTAQAPGPRASRFQDVLDRSLAHTLAKIGWDNFAACYPTIAARAPATLRAVQKQMVDRLGALCKVRSLFFFFFLLLLLFALLRWGRAGELRRHACEWGVRSRG